MTEYPILVRDFDGEKALTIICEKCGAEEVIDADDILNEGLYACPAWADGCEGSAVMKYECADECPSCKKLGFFTQSTADAFSVDLKGCCSRACLFQHEYAESLDASAPHPKARR